VDVDLGAVRWFWAVRHPLSFFFGAVRPVGVPLCGVTDSGVLGVWFCGAVQPILWCGVEWSTLVFGSVVRCG
jgi:hypothetical protein